MEGPTRGELLELFSCTDGPRTPLTTSEIASKLDCDDETALAQLRALADGGRLQTRVIGDEYRLWWTTSAGSNATAESGFSSEKPRIDMEFRSAELTEPFHGIPDDPVTAELDSVVPLPDGSHIQYWSITGTSAEELLETVMNSPTIFNTQLMSTVDGTHRIEAYSTSQSLFSKFGELEGNAKSATYDGRELRIVAEFPPAVDALEIEEAVRNICPDLKLVSTRQVITASTDHHVIEEHLTARQLTALQMAYFGGYFEQPRTCSGVELADGMGISKQAFHEHLRKAYKTVFEQLFTNVDETELLDW